MWKLSNKSQHHVAQNFLSQEEVIRLFRPGDLNEVRHRKSQGIEIIRLMEEREKRELGGQVEDTKEERQGSEKETGDIGRTLFRSFIRRSADS